MHRKILALLALAAGWAVLVADGGNAPCGADFDVQYAFQTHCMGEPASGFLNLALRDRGYSCGEGSDGYIYYELWKSELDKVLEQGLNVQSLDVLFKGPEKKRIAIGFDFEIRGEPLDAPHNPDVTPPTFVCKDSRAHDTLAVDKDYLCENIDNPAETCELKLTYQPPE